MEGFKRAIAAAVGLFTASGAHAEESKIRVEEPVAMAGSVSFEDREARLTTLGDSIARPHDERIQSLPIERPQEQQSALERNFDEDALRDRLNRDVSFGNNSKGQFGVTESALGEDIVGGRVVIRREE